MTVPEAAMHETDSFEPAEDQVRRSGKVPIVKTIPEAPCMKCPPKDQLGLRVPATDPRHHSRPDGSINYIRHLLICFAEGDQDCSSISPNVVYVSEHGRVVSHWLAWSGLEHADVPDTLTDSRLMGQSQNRVPISQILACTSRLLGDCLGRRPVKGRPEAA